MQIHQIKFWIRSRDDLSQEQPVSSFPFPGASSSYPISSLLLLLATNRQQPASSICLSRLLGRRKGGIADEGNHNIYRVFFLEKDIEIRVPLTVLIYNSFSEKRSDQCNTIPLMSICLSIKMVSDIT